MPLQPGEGEVPGGEGGDRYHCRARDDDVHGNTRSASRRCHSDGPLALTRGCEGELDFGDAWQGLDLIPTVEGRLDDALDGRHRGFGDAQGL
jgi:hypothetical protein